MGRQFTEFEPNINESNWNTFMELLVQAKVDGHEYVIRLHTGFSEVVIACSNQNELIETLLTLTTDGHEYQVEKIEKLLFSLN